MFAYPLGDQFIRKIPDPCLILMLNDMAPSQELPGVIA
jgi:hypothetical protein